MKKILLIAPKSFPVIDAEAIVNIKLLTALSKDGRFEIDLISKMGGQNYPTDSLESFNVKINEHHIVKVENRISLLSIWQHAVSLFKFGSTFMGAHWSVKALKVVKMLLDKKQYDYVATKNSPSFLLGYYAKKRYKAKWVATWNDPYPEIKYPHPYGQGADAKPGLLERLQIRIMRKADVHIFPSSRLRDHMLRYLKVGKECCVVIPHVALNTSSENFQCKDREMLRLLHSGNLKSPRNPRPFLRALGEFHEMYPDNRLSVTLMGVYDKDIPELIKELKLENVVLLKKAVSYQESITALADYHLCLIIEADCEEGIFLPTKVSDFFQCGKRIYALSPEKGVLNDLFREKKISYFSYVDNEESIFNELSRIYQDYSKGLLWGTLPSIPEDFSEKSVSDKYYAL